MKPTKRKKLPDLIDLRKWLERKISSHESWETTFFGMDWEKHEDEEEWAWELYFKEPGTGDKLMMAVGLTHVRDLVKNFLVSELNYIRKAWTAFEPNTDEEQENEHRDEERPHGWQLVNELTQLTAFNVRYHGLNFNSVLAGQVEEHKGRLDRSRIYFRPYGQWYSGYCSKSLPTFDGMEDGCEYLRPIPLSENIFEGESYLSVDDSIWNYIDVDVKPKELG